MLLAENVARVRGLDDFAFWVLSPRENVELWRDPEADLEPQFRSLLRPLGNACFRRLALEDVLESIRPLVRGAPEAA